MRFVCVEVLAHVKGWNAKATQLLDPFLFSMKISNVVPHCCIGMWAGIETTSCRQFLVFIRLLYKRIMAKCIVILFMVIVIS